MRVTSLQSATSMLHKNKRATLLQFSRNGHILSHRKKVKMQQNPTMNPNVVPESQLNAIPKCHSAYESMVHEDSEFEVRSKTKNWSKSNVSAVRPSRDTGNENEAQQDIDIGTNPSPQKIRKTKHSNVRKNKSFNSGSWIGTKFDEEAKCPSTVDKIQSRLSKASQTDFEHQNSKRNYCYRKLGEIA